MLCGAGAHQRQAAVVQADSDRRASRAMTLVLIVAPPILPWVTYGSLSGYLLSSGGSVCILNMAACGNSWLFRGAFF